MKNTNNTGKSTWNVSKVIKQKFYKSFEVDHSEKDVIQLWQQDGSESNLVIIEKENAREVALAIFDFEKEKTDFAVGFAEWKNKNEYRYSRKYKMYQKTFINETLFYTTDELLKQYQQTLLTNGK